MIVTKVFLSKKSVTVRLSVISSFILGLLLRAAFQKLQLVSVGNNYSADEVSPVI